MERAQHFFRRAIELDPLFATPHAMLAFTYDFATSLGGASRMNQEQAKAEARKAIELDPDDASALAVMAWIPVTDGHYVYKSTLDLSDMSDTMNDRTAESMFPRCAADLKPGVSDAPLHGFGA
jgi:Tfp pilus assembly protein PilF